MGRLLLLTVMCAGVCAALVAAASAVGRLHGPGLFAPDEFDCASPCWQGIAPGEMRAGRARRLLAENPYVAPGSVRYNVPSVDYEDEGVLYWDMFDSRAGVLKRARAHVKGWVVTALEVPGLNARLGDLVVALGEPTWVVARYTPAQGAYLLVADVLYPDLGLRLAASGEGYRHLSPALVVNRVYYGGRAGAPQLGGDILPDALAWKGFVSIERYGAALP